MLTAIVTGCSRPTGFGQMTAKALAAAGYQVFATLRDSNRARSLVEWAEGEGYWLKTIENDVCRPASNRAVVETVVRQTGSVDLLVNNVGMNSFGALESLKAAHIREVMETDFFSAVDMTRTVLPEMRKNRGGRIIFVSSIAGVSGVPGESIYCASKFALEGLAEALAMEVERFGIHISTSVLHFSTQA